MIKKIAGNWHKIDIWEKEKCIVGYKSGGIIFVSLDNGDEIRYLPFYNFQDFTFINNLLVISDKLNNVFEFRSIHSGIDLKDIKFPKKKVNFNYNGFNIIEEIRATELTENFLVCAYKQKGIDIFDKVTKRKIIHYDFPGYSFIDDIKYYKNKIYIADVFGLRVLDISDITNPVLDDSMTYKGWPKDIAVVKNYVFVADVLGVKVFDKSKGFSLVGKFETNKNRIAKVLIRNNLAFLACEARGLRILDISELQNPKLISGLLLPKGVWDIFEHNGYVYCAAYTEGLYKVEYANLKVLKTVSIFKASKEIIGVFVDKRAVFASCSYVGITILDHDLHFINEIKIKNGRCWTTIPYKNLLLSACGKEGVLIYSIDNLSNPVFITKLETKEARDLIVKDDCLYVADGQNGVEIYRIDNILKPKHIKNIPSAAFTRGIMVDDKYIYKADGDGGVEIYERKF